jgi:hypothetical protein
MVSRLFMAVKCQDETVSWHMGSEMDDDHLILQILGLADHCRSSTASTGLDVRGSLFGGLVSSNGDLITSGLVHDQGESDDLFGARERI